MSGSERSRKPDGRRQNGFHRQGCLLEISAANHGDRQAAGVAAALCVKKGITPRKLEGDVSELQKILVKQGAILYGTR